MKSQNTILAAALAVLPTVVLAVPPSYTYVEANYIATDQSGDGYGFNGSFALTHNIHAFGGYAITRDNFGGSLYEEDSAYHLGLGYNYSLAPSLDLVGRVSYIHAKCHSVDFGCGFNQFNESSGNNSSKNSYGLEGQLRWMATDRLELNGGVIRNNGFGNFDASTALEAGIRYDVIPNLSVGGNVLFAGNSTGAYTVGIRYNFGGMGGSLPNPFESLSDSSK